MTVEVSNFNLANKLGQDNVLGEGHIHYFLDVEPPTNPDRPAVTAPGTYAASAATTHTWTGVSPGRHKLSGQLVNNNHRPLTPPVVSIVEIDILSGTAAATATPTARPPSPTPTTPPLAGPPVTINVTAQGFSFNPRTITVSPGASVSITFNNRDSFPHNIAVYESADAARVIFKGEIISGPATTTYQLTAPNSPGNYFFRCDVHPTSMTGTFVTTGGGY